MDFPLLFPALPGPGSQARPSEETQRLSYKLGWLTPNTFPNLHESLEILSFSKYLLSVCSVLGIDLALARQR